MSTATVTSPEPTPAAKPLEAGTRLLRVRGNAWQGNGNSIDVEVLQQAIELTQFLFHREGNEFDAKPADEEVDRVLEVLTKCHATISKLAIPKLTPAELPALVNQP